MNHNEFERLVEEAKILSPSDVHSLNSLVCSHFYWSGEHIRIEPEKDTPEFRRHINITKMEEAEKLVRVYIARLKTGDNIKLKTLRKGLCESNGNH